MTHSIHIHTHIQPHYPTCVYAQTHTHIHNHTLPHTCIHTPHTYTTPYIQPHTPYIYTHTRNHTPPHTCIYTDTHTWALVQCVALSIPAGAGESLVSLFVDFRAIRDPGILSWCAEALQLTWHCPRWPGRSVEPRSTPCPRQLHLSHCFCQFVKSGKNTFTDI